MRNIGYEPNDNLSALFVLVFFLPLLMLFFRRFLDSIRKK